VSGAEAAHGPVGGGERLRRALADRGFDVDVEIDGTLAVLRLAAQGLNGPALADPAARADVVRLGREAGFTHVALELAPPVEHIDAAASVDDASVHRPDARG